MGVVDATDMVVGVGVVVAEFSKGATDGGDFVVDLFGGVWVS